MRAANSSERSPANTRCVWLSTKPGITQRPAASSRSSAAAPARSIAATRSPSSTSAASRTMPERALAERGVVGDEQADVVDDERAHPAQRRRQLGRHVDAGMCAPSRTTHSPPTITWRTSAAAPAKTTDSSACRTGVPGQPHAVERDRR